MILDDNETILFHIHRHWIIVCIKIIPVVLLALLPLIFPAVLDFFLPKELERFEDAGWALYFMWLIILWVWGFWLWTEEHLDVWVLTNTKVISVDQKSLFFRHMSTLELEKIQDISIEVNGFIATMFGYGTIRIQTAGETTRFELVDAYDPEGAKEKILEMQRQLRDIILKRQSSYIRDGIGYQN